MLAFLAYCGPDVSAASKLLLRSGERSDLFLFSPSGRLRCRLLLPCLVGARPAAAAVGVPQLNLRFFFVVFRSRHYIRHPMSKTDPASYSSASDTLLRDIIKLGETRLQSQLTVAIAADQRALVLSGFLVPTIGALIAAAAALMLATPMRYDLGVVAFLGAGGLLISLALAIVAARPVGWHFPGIRPGNWVKDLAESNSDPHGTLAAIAAGLEKQAEANSKLLSVNGWLIRCSLIMAGITLLGCGSYLVWYLG